MGNWTGAFPWYWCLLISPRHLIRLIMIFCDLFELIFDFSSLVVDFSKTYLAERSQCVSAGGVLSSFLPVLRGVPQGSVFFSLMVSV
jgi:hypothetical protein